MAAIVGGMEAEVEAKVREALALLRQAGRLDLLKEGALATTRPARRASAGVAAVVAACSPPRAVYGGKVRCASRGAGRGVGPGRVLGGCMGGLELGNPRGFPESRDARRGCPAAPPCRKGGRGRVRGQASGPWSRASSGRARRER
ncbi:hypothetical protein NDU88_004260 [Pleurodeles waltl]|uniref:Uncharacterized protein n=1 Tax=Pleurodeles waltl TaxID=8319 RepID=A0AAV7MWZ6_PLEWA|nr:hypothetical protein NDU88_004260 [Pleurodeles waltl]